MSAGTRLPNIVKVLVAGLLVIAALTIAPISLSPAGHAEMAHASLSQNCLFGCPNGGLVQLGITSSQNYQDDQNKKAGGQPGPYYLAFAQFYVPRKLISQIDYFGHVLRPPDLVKLFANFRD